MTEESKEFIDDDELEPSKTLDCYINKLLSLTSDLLNASVNTVVFTVVDDLTEEMDHILIEMRHAKWDYFKGQVSNPNAKVEEEEEEE